MTKGADPAATTESATTSPFVPVPFSRKFVEHLAAVARYDLAMSEAKQKKEEEQEKLNKLLKQQAKLFKNQGLELDLLRLQNEVDDLVASLFNGAKIPSQPVALKKFVLDYTAGYTKFDAPVKANASTTPKPEPK